MDSKALKKQQMEFFVYLESFSENKSTSCSSVYYLHIFTSLECQG